MGQAPKAPQPRDSAWVPKARSAPDCTLVSTGCSRLHTASSIQTESQPSRMVPESDLPHPHEPFNRNSPLWVGQGGCGRNCFPEIHASPPSLRNVIVPGFPVHYF